MGTLDVRPRACAEHDYFNIGVSRVLSFNLEARSDRSTFVVVELVMEHLAFGAVEHNQIVIPRPQVSPSFSVI